MDKRYIGMHLLKQILSDFIQGEGIKKISRVRSVSRNTIKSYRKVLSRVLVDNPNLKNDMDKLLIIFERYLGDKNKSVNFIWLDNNFALVEELFSKCSNRKRVLEILQSRGFKGSYSSFLRYLDTNKITKDKPVVRIETNAGEIAQVDFGYIGKIYDREEERYIKAYVFVMTLGFSRDAYYEIVKNQNLEVWYNCHIHAFEHFGGVPQTIIPDNLKSGIIKASFTDPILNKTYAELAEHYGFQIDPCIPNMPEHKGKVESGVKYAKGNFMQLREFKDFEDANAQLKEWNENIARQRVHGTTKRKPVDLFENFEKQKLKPLIYERFEIPVYKRCKVSRDIHIQFNNSYYSVPHELIGEMVTVKAVNTQISIYHSERVVALHEKAKKGERKTKAEHYPPGKFKYLQYDKDYCLDKASEYGTNVHKLVDYMLNQTSLRNLKGAQYLLKLADKYSIQRLDKACERSILYSCFEYKAIKSILESGLDKQSEENIKPNPELSNDYARDIKEMLKKEALK